MRVSQFQPSVINNNQNKQNQNVSFNAGKIHINKKDILPGTAERIRNNLQANSTYKEFTKLFDADFSIYTDISVHGDFQALVDISYKKIDPNKNKLQRFVQKIIQKLTKKTGEPIYKSRFTFSDWSCDLAAENLSKYLVDNNGKLYKLLQKIIKDTYKN